jgi:hypothetical protein
MAAVGVGAASWMFLDRVAVVPLPKPLFWPF